MGYNNHAHLSSGGSSRKDILNQMVLMSLSEMNWQPKCIIFIPMPLEVLSFRWRILMLKKESEVVIVKIDDKTTMEFVRNAIATVITDEKPAAKEDNKESKDKKDKPLDKYDRILLDTFPASDAVAKYWISTQNEEYRIFLCLPDISLF